MDTIYPGSTAEDILSLTRFRREGTKVGSDGFVKLVDFMGSDEKLVKVARVSTGRGFVSWDPYVRCKDCNATVSGDGSGPWEYGGQVCSHVNLEKFPNGDMGIINNLVRERHTSPIEFGEIIFHLRIPMHIWRQLVRHRTANVSEYSTRYSEAIDEMETTEPTAWRLQATKNRQGSDGLLDHTEGGILTLHEEAFQRTAREVYEERLSFGVAKEQARKDLPLSNYTEVFWKMDCHNLMHCLSLRLDLHAQKETREFGAGLASIFEKLFPRLWSAFEEFKLYSVTFSRTEMVVMKGLLLDWGKEGQALEHAFNVAGHPFFGPGKKADRERFLAKLGVKR